MKDFIDKTDTVAGTPINREAMMAVQGFIGNTVSFSGGNIVETNADGHTKTVVFNDDGSITETFIGDKTITKTTIFDGDTIREVIS